jgi:hypothetical protein
MVGRAREVFTRGLLNIEGFVIRNGLLIPIRRGFDEMLSAALSHSVLYEAKREHALATSHQVDFNEFRNAVVGFTDEAELNALKLIFQNVAWANVGDSSGLQPSGTAGSFYVSLHTADPTETGSQTSSEAAYTGYGRVAVARSSGGWTCATATGTSTAKNAAAITFGASTSGAETETYTGLGTAATLAGHLVCAGAITSPAAGLVVNSGITPQFANAGDLTVSLD